MLKYIIAFAFTFCLAETAFSQVSQSDKDLNDSISKFKRPERLKWIESYMEKNPSSQAGPFFLSEFLKFDTKTTLEEHEAMMKGFTGAAKQSDEYLAMAESIESKKKLLPGNIAPDFTLKKPDGTAFTLSSMRGKYILVDFWASWCKPCRAAIPHWKEVYAKYKDRGFDILAVSSDQDDKSWRTAMEQEQMPWPQVCDDFPEKYKQSRVGMMYQIRFIPFYILLDKKGKILVATNDHDKVDQKLIELLGS